VHAHAVGAVDQKALVGEPLIVGVDHANPQEDIAGVNGIFEVGGVPRNKPKA